MTVSDDLLERHVVVAARDAALFMNCALNVDAVLAVTRDAARVVVTDRSCPAVGAAARRAAAATKVSVLAGHGTQPLPPDFTADIVAIRVPREKLPAIQLLADAFAVLKPGGRCYLVGATNEGVKSVARAAERAFGNAEVLAHDSGHRIILCTRRTDAPVDESVFDHPLLAANAFHTVNANLRDESFTLYSRPGVFSWEHVDEATALLADVMPIAEGQAVLDLGCGSGALGVVAATLSRTGRVVLADADTEAVRSAQRTVGAAGLANVEVIASDVASAVIDERFDVVVTNPPFHAGARSTDLTLPQRFIRDAHHVLSVGGSLVLVANRTLPYEHDIVGTFGNIRTLHEGARFKVVAATRTSTDSRRDGHRGETATDF